MGTILVPLFAHYRPTAPLVQAAYAEGLLSLTRLHRRSVGLMQSIPPAKAA